MSRHSPSSNGLSSRGRVHDICAFVSKKYWLALAVAAGAFCAGTGPSAAAYVQTNLVSDIPDLAAITDPSLINPWGHFAKPHERFWVSNQGTSTSTLYAVTAGTNVTKVNVNPNGVVNIPTTAPPQGPTGQVNNTNTASFQLTPGTLTSSSRFIFANLNGTVSGWAGGRIRPSWRRPPVPSTPASPSTRHRTAFTPPTAPEAASTYSTVRSLRCSSARRVRGPQPSRRLRPVQRQNIGGTVYVTYALAGRAAEMRGHARPGSRECVR